MLQHTKESLIAFEKRIADAFADTKIRAPVHLSGGNEEQLIEIFKHVKPTDWVFSTWRSHYHALLHGISEEWLFAEILAGRSMSIMNREHRFFSSAIVGGILPIACGVAMAIKRRAIYDNSKVWCFIGDMTARTGIYHEFREYCAGHNLPVVIVIEDNGLSTNTPTNKAWNDGSATGGPSEMKYLYTRTYPHVGLSKRVQF